MIVVQSRQRSSTLWIVRWLLVFIFVNGLWAGSGTQPVRAADNAENNIPSTLNQTTYIEIYDAAGLDAIRSKLSGVYRLMADIDLSGYPNWTPIGADGAAFTGELDGNGKKITGLKITDTTLATGQGLFGAVNSPGKIHDLTIDNAAVTAGSNAGILVGMNGGTIERCGVSGSIGGTTNVGGLAGQNTSTVGSSYSTATVTGQASVGGLVGSNSGTITQSYAASPVLASVFNNYLQFDGLNDYIEISHITAYQTSSFTLEAWFQWDEGLMSDGPEKNDADVQFIIGKGVENFEIHTEGGSGQRGIRFIPIPRTSIVGETPDAYHDVLDVIQPGWFHVAASYDFTNKEVRVYINGVLQDIYHWDPTNTYRQNDGKVVTVDLKDPNTNPFASNMEDLLIGARSPSTSPSMFFKGKIADVRFWNIVRTGEEIDADKNKQLTGNETGLMGYWKLNEGSGTTAVDSSINHNNGTLMNTDVGVWVNESISGVGGLVGANTGSVDAASFYDSDVSGMSDTGKGAPLTTTAMQSYTTFDNAGWDFTNTWQITDGVTYPSFIRYTLTYDYGDNGGLTGETTQTVCPHGFGSMVTAVPDAGYHFTQWNDSGPSAARTDTDVTHNINVIAQFAINTYTLTYTAGANGSITGSTPQTVDHGNSGTTVTAVPAPGYHFVKWSDNVSTASRTDSGVTGDVTVTAQFEINQYTLRYSAGGGGTITGSTTQTVNHGSSGSPVTAVANTGYHFVQWSDNVSSAERTDSNVTTDISVTAGFEINQYTLNYSAGAGGSLTGTTPQTVGHGSSGTAVTAVPDEHYHFIQWSDGVLTATRTDSNVTGDKSVTAQFAIDQYSLSYSAGAHGSLTGETTQSVGYGGSGTTVTAVPDTGYHFVKWSDGNTSAGRTDSDITHDINVSAEFEINQYSLLYAAGAHGSLTGVASQTVNHGGSGTEVTAVPETGYHFVKWSDDVLTPARTDSNVQGNLTVTAQFAINQYSLTYSADEHGSLTGDDSQTVDYGGTGSEVSAAADTGYHFVQWSDGLLTSSRTDSNVTGNINVTAQFAINQYTLTYAAGTGGSVSGSLSQTVDHGSSGSTVTAVPNSHYHFVRWSDGVDTASRTDSGVTGNKSVSAQFALDQYTLTYAAGEHGSLTGTAAQTVNYDSSGSVVTAVPDAGYHFVKWSDDVSTASRTDLNVTGNISVTAEFAINKYTLTYAAGTGGSLTGTAVQTVDHGSSGTAVTAVPAAKYRFVQWSDGITTATRRDLLVTDDLSVTALFEPDQFTLTYEAGAGGSVTGDTHQTVYRDASGTAVTAVPSAGYYFVRWSDGVTTATRTDRDVTDSITATAEFAPYHIYYFPIVGR